MNSLVIAILFVWLISLLFYPIFLYFISKIITIKRFRFFIRIWIDLVFIFTITTFLLITNPFQNHFFIFLCSSAFYFILFYLLANWWVWSMFIDIWEFKSMLFFLRLSYTTLQAFIIFFIFLVWIIFIWKGELMWFWVNKVWNYSWIDNNNNLYYDINNIWVYDISVSDTNWDNKYDSIKYDINKDWKVDMTINNFEWNSIISYNTFNEQKFYIFIYTIVFIILLLIITVIKENILVIAKSKSKTKQEESYSPEIKLDFFKKSSLTILLIFILNIIFWSFANAKINILEIKTSINENKKCSANPMLDTNCFEVKNEMRLFYVWLYNETFYREYINKFYNKLNMCQNNFKTCTEEYITITQSEFNERRDKWKDKKPIRPKPEEITDEHLKIFYEDNKWKEIFNYINNNLKWTENEKNPLIKNKISNNILPWNEWKFTPTHQNTISIMNELWDNLEEIDYDYLKYIDYYEGILSTFEDSTTNILEWINNENLLKRIEEWDDKYVDSYMTSIFTKNWLLIENSITNIDSIIKSLLDKYNNNISSWAKNRWLNEYKFLEMTDLTNVLKNTPEISIFNSLKKKFKNDYSKVLDWYLSIYFSKITLWSNPIDLGIWILWEVFDIIGFNELSYDTNSKKLWVKIFEMFDYWYWTTYNDVIWYFNYIKSESESKSEWKNYIQKTAIKVRAYSDIAYSWFSVAYWNLMYYSNFFWNLMNNAWNSIYWLMTNKK